jgi:hypothetical protein
MGLFSKLQNGDTVLKSLKFGKDRLGGGNSNQPYIQNPIIDEPGQLSQADNDFLFRNGIKAPINAIEDVTRLTKYMFDLKSPSGILFTIKQNLLSRVAVPNEASQKWGANNPGPAYAGGKLNEGVYTPLSTIAQAGVGFLGTHLNKQGIDPTGLINALSLKKYEDVVKEKNQKDFNILNIDFPIGTVQAGNALTNNPLTPGLNPFAQTSNLPSLDFSALSNIATFQNRLLDLWYGKTFSPNSSISVLEYGGGPGSILGIGKTRIPFGENQRTGINNPLSVSNPQFYFKGGKTSPSNYIVKDFNKDGTVRGYKYTDTLNYFDLLGASVAQGLTPLEIGINENGQFTTFQTDKPLKNITQESDSTYNSPIENILIDYDRQLTSPLFFQVGRTWVTTSDGNFIADYSSKNTLTRDYTNTDVNNAGGGLWKDFNNGSKQHKKGYLADLDKNAGTWKDSKGVLQLHNNNAYPGGIAPDFRLTPREKRGLYKLPTGAQNLESLEPLPGYEIGQGETRSEYHNSAGNLEKNTLQRIYYRSDRSSFASTKNPFLPSSKDIIPFNITILNPTNLSLKTLTFRAYIDSLSDAYSADWKAQTYMGVGEKFWKYNSFGREIGFELSVVAENPDHLDDMYRNLNILAGSIAPTYTKQGYMAGNIHKITLGNYLINQYGIVTGLSYNLVEDSTWDITPGKQLPKYITVSGIKFTPIHNFRPEYLPDEPHRYINQTVNTNS